MPITKLQRNKKLGEICAKKKKKICQNNQKFEIM